MVGTDVTECGLLRKAASMVIYIPVACSSIAPTSMVIYIPVAYSSIVLSYIQHFVSHCKSEGPTDERATLESHQTVRPLAIFMGRSLHIYSSLPDASACHGLLLWFASVWVLSMWQVQNPE